jgi:hypothetical protein
VQEKTPCQAIKPRAGSLPINLSSGSGNKPFFKICARNKFLPAAFYCGNAAFLLYACGFISAIQLFCFMPDINLNRLSWDKNFFICIKAVFAGF